MYLPLPPIGGDAGSVSSVIIMKNILLHGRALKLSVFWDLMHEITIVCGCQACIVLPARWPVECNYNTGMKDAN